MAKLVFNDEDEVEVSDGEAIKPYCEDAGIPFACEEGICGTCIVEVEEGQNNLSEPTTEEYDFLGEPGDERLACQCKIKHGCVKLRF